MTVEEIISARSAAERIIDKAMQDFLLVTGLKPGAVSITWGQPTVRPTGESEYKAPHCAFIKVTL